MSSPHDYQYQSNNSQSAPYGSGHRPSRQPQPLQPIQGASGWQSTSSSVPPDTSGQTQPLYENETQQAGHYYPASGSTLLPSNAMSSTYDYQYQQNPVQSAPYGSGHTRSSRQPQPLQPIQGASGWQSTPSSVPPDTSGQTQPLYENETQQAGHYYPASGSTSLPSNAMSSTYDYQYQPNPVQSVPHSSGRRSSQQPQPLQHIQRASGWQSTSSSVPPDTSVQIQPLYEDETHRAGQYWERNEGYNDAQTHVPPFPTQDSGHSRQVHSPYASHGSPPRHRQGISVPSNPSYTPHPQPERSASGRQDYSQPHWQQQQSSPRRSADPRYPDFEHTSAPSQPIIPQYTSPQGPYTSLSQPEPPLDGPPSYPVVGRPRTGGSNTSDGQRRQQHRGRETDRRHSSNDDTSNRRGS